MPDTQANRIAQLSHLINGTLNLDEVFERTLEQACLLTGGERAAILLFQGEGGLRCQAAVGMACPAWETERFGFARRLVEQVLQEQRARLTSDAQVDLRPDLARSLGIQSILCTPLVSSGHSIGVLYVERRLTLGVFTVDDLERLELISMHCAVAVENARRYGYALESARREGAASMAEALVLALLPQEAPQIPGYDIAARWQSAREISADFYDIFPLAEENRWGLMVADVSERGAPAAISMALTRSIIRGSVLTTPGPGAGIYQANRLLCRDFETGRYVLLFYGELDPLGTLRYINAGHPPPFWWRATTGTLTPLTSNSAALGLDADSRLVEHHVTLQDDDVLFFWSDGLAEIANQEGLAFGSERLMGLLRLHAHQPAALIAAAILEEVGLWLRGQPPHDDLLLIVLKYQPLPTLTAHTAPAPE